MTSFRAHHFLCAFCFQGKGYSAKFVHNFSTIMKTLNADDGADATITVAPHTDDICAPCPHKRDLKCESEDKVRQLDAAHSDAFGFKPNSIIKWLKFKQSLPLSLTIEKFHKICEGCEWKASGMCESVLRSSGIK